MTRKGGWIQTYTGHCFWPLDPRPDEVHIEDAAHALSMLCRYNGHTTRFYSVAEHSVLVSMFVPAEYALWGLLHDVPEAYCSDVPRPLKRHLREWRPIEAGIMRAVCARFGLPEDEPAEVKHVDLAITSDERNVLMPPGDREWPPLPPALGAHVIGYMPSAAEYLFLRRFRELTKGDQ